jgi:kinesin family protein 4/21/27
LEALFSFEMTGNRSCTSEDEEEEEVQRVPQHELIEDGSRSPSPTDDFSLQTPTNNNNGNVNKSSGASCVQVAVRVRPLLSSLESGCAHCVDVMHGAGDGITGNPSVIKIGGEAGPAFTFDEVFPTSTTQVQVFEHRVAPLVESCMEGYNATILAYGQTGSGKTHTVIGPSVTVQDDTSSGIIPRAVTSLFQKLQSVKQEAFLKRDPPSGKSAEAENDEVSYEFEVRVQFLELYGEEIRDLLTSSASAEKLSIRDVGTNDEPEVVGATAQTVESAEEAMRCLTRGMLRRVTAATAMNEASSRSHAIFSIIVSQTWINNSPDSTGPQVRQSRFNFVDLAGSERQKRTQAEGKRLKEGIGRCHHL